MKEKVTPANLLSEREQEILKRLAAGLSDQQIADELFLSLNTVKWYNRQIYSKLGVKSRTQAIARATDLVLPDRANGGSTSPLPLAKYNLPAQTLLFVGRSREIAEVKQLLDTSRLLTLTGTGGIGKTRLALRVAAEVAEMFADGVCFVGGTPSILSSWQNAPSRSCGWRVMIIGPDDSNWNWKICVRYWNGRQAAERWCKGYD